VRGVEVAGIGKRGASTNGHTGIGDALPKLAAKAVVPGNPRGRPDVRFVSATGCHWGARWFPDSNVATWWFEVAAKHLRSQFPRFDSKG
jgi:hypothetical protein